jgi:hypothetical protein
VNYPPPEIPVDAEANAISEQVWLWVRGFFDQLDGLLEEPDRSPAASDEALLQLMEIVALSALMVSCCRTGRTEGLRDLVQDRLAEWP